MQFASGVLYQIVCKQTQQALKIQNHLSPENSRVISVKFNSQDLTQLWFIEKIKNQTYEIINALSDDVCTDNKSQVNLKRGDQSGDQQFFITKADYEAYYNYFQIINYRSHRAFAYEGFLRTKAVDINDQSQLFRFMPVTNNQAVNSTTVIVNSKCGKVLDVPGGTNSKGTRIIQYSRNRRFNQRWLFIRYNKAYMIGSFKSGLYLDISGESHDANSQVIQWSQTGNTNQLWTLKRVGQDLYKIISVHQPSLQLGIYKDNQDDGGKLSIVKHQTIWKLEGFIPPLV